MPAAIEACKSSLLSDWNSGKKKKPTRYKAGDKWKPIEDEKDLESAAWAICTASVGAEVDMSSIQLEEVAEVPFDNPVMTAIGATNKPHIMGLQPIQQYEQDGEQWAKVPILILGRWFHRNGILNFTKKVADRLKSALHSGEAGHDVALDARHFSEKGAMGWVRDLVTEKLENGLQQVSALTKLTKWGIEAIRDQLFRYGSIEFHPNFQNRLAEAASALSFEGEGNELIRLEEGELPIQARIIAQEETMPDDKKPVEPGGQPQAPAVSLEQQFEQYRLDQEKKLKDLEERLEAERDRATSLEQFAVRQFVDAIVAKAENYRDSEGRAHSKYVLEWAENVLMCKATGEGEEVIKLEAGADGAHAYYRQQIARLLQEAPGTVPVTPSQTEPDQTRKLEADTGEKDDKAARAEVMALFGMVPEGEE